MLWWMIGFALAANPWKDKDTDIRVEAVVPVAPEVVTEAFSDFSTLERLFDVQCLKRWTHGSPSAGLGARSRVVYTPGLMNRRLDVVVAELEPGRKVLLDHLGNRGFFTKVTAVAEEGGTRVVVSTPINAPPWPFRKLYHLDVKPEWSDCYLKALKRLGEASP